MTSFYPPASAAKGLSRFTAEAEKITDMPIYLVLRHGGYAADLYKALLILFLYT